MFVAQMNHDIIDEVSFWNLFRATCLYTIFMHHSTKRGKKEGHLPLEANSKEILRQKCCVCTTMYVYSYLNVQLKKPVL